MTMFFYLALIDILCSHRNLQKKAKNRVNRTARSAAALRGSSLAPLVTLSVGLMNDYEDEG